MFVDVSYWHFRDVHRCPLFYRFREQSGHQPAMRSRFMITCP